jgi:hypothetical protein
VRRFDARGQAVEAAEVLDDGWAGAEHRAVGGEVGRFVRPRVRRRRRVRGPGVEGDGEAPAGAGTDRPEREVRVVPVAAAARTVTGGSPGYVGVPVSTAWVGSYAARGRRPRG